MTYFSVSQEKSGKSWNLKRENKGEKKSKARDFLLL